MSDIMLKGKLFDERSVEKVVVPREIKEDVPSPLTFVLAPIWFMFSSNILHLKKLDPLATH